MVRFPPSSDVYPMPPALLRYERDFGIKLIHFLTLGRPKTALSSFAPGDGLVTPLDFVSMIGTLMPITPIGPT
jgi:hypothetical protein